MNITLSNKIISKSIFLLFLLLSAFSISAQENCFSLQYDKGCVPADVVIIECPDITNATYSYNGEPFTNNLSFTFRTPGVFPVVQSVQNPDGGSFKDTLYFEAVQPEYPVFDFTYCSSNRLRFNLLDNVYDSIFIDFGDGNQQTHKAISNFDYEYTTSGNKAITLQGYLASGQPINEQVECTDTIFVVSVGENILNVGIDSLIVQEENNLKLTFQLNQNYKYLLEEKEGTGNYNTIMELTDESSVILPNKNTAAIGYCYRINTYDSCNVSSPNNYLNEICSSDINVSAQLGFNNINWSTFSNGIFSSFNIYRDGQLVKTFTNSDSISWNDYDIQCDITYQYYLDIVTKNNENSNLHHSLTKTVSVVGITSDKPNAINNLTSNIENNSIVLKWDDPLDVKIENYSLTKTVNGTDRSTITITENPFIDENVNTSENQYCYQLNIIDKCGSQSDTSNTTCPVFLKTSKESKNNLLEWTAYQGFSSFFYTVEQLDIEGQVVKNLAVIDSDLTYTHPIEEFDRNVMIYRIRITSQDGLNQVSFSNTLSVKTDPEIEVPDAFSPNDDGLNDTFKVSVQLLKTFELTIYDRWGSIIFQTKDVNSAWNGKINSKDAFEGTYSYVVTGTDEAGNIYQKKGVLLLIR